MLIFCDGNNVNNLTQILIGGGIQREKIFNRIADLLNHFINGHCLLSLPPCGNQLVVDTLDGFLNRARFILEDIHAYDVIGIHVHVFLQLLLEPILFRFESSCVNDLISLR